jgi:hypothetical protein
MTTSSRTLGSLSQEDIGKVVTIRNGPTTVEGILAGIIHDRGDTSGRAMTRVRLVWKSDDHDKIQSGSNAQDVFRKSGDIALAIPNNSNHPVEVRPEQ